MIYPHEVYPFENITVVVPQSSGITSLSDPMFIITAIYVIATVAICIFNYRSAEATKAQTAELKKQFDETNRPQIDVSIELVRSSLFVFKIENVGLRYARNVNVFLDKRFMGMIKTNDKKNKFERLIQIQYNLGIGQKKFWTIDTHYNKDFVDQEFSATVTYLGNREKYKEKFDFILSSNDSSLIYDSVLDEVRVHQKSLAENAKNELKELKSIANCLDKLVSHSINKDKE